MGGRDSMLIIEQVNEEFNFLLLLIKLLLKTCQILFSDTQFDHIPRAQNKHADDLATLTSKLDIPNEVDDVRVIGRL